MNKIFLCFKEDYRLGAIDYAWLFCSKGKIDYRKLFEKSLAILMKLSQLVLSMH